MLKIENVSKSIGSFSLNEISLSVKKDDYFVLVGESGSGKSLLLDLIAGLILPDSGDLWLNGENITRKKIQDRSVGLVMQDYALFPHLTVYQNIAYSLKCRRERPTEIIKQVKNHSDQLNISDLLERKIPSLSGGELQRVALARTLISNPDILLLDEPMASIDATLKKDIRHMLQSIHKRGIPVIHVTHDYEEAISLATMICVINQGHIMQAGTPTEIFNQPKNYFIADLAGIKNFFPAYIVETMFGSNLKTARVDDMNIKLQTESDGSSGYVIIPPDRIILSRKEIESSAQNCFSGIVRDIYQSPYGYRVTVDIGVRLFVSITAASFDNLEIKNEAPVWVSFKAGAVRFIEKD